MTEPSALSEPLAGSPSEQAIPALLDLHGGKIYALGVKICGGTSEAQDLVQETFLAAFRRWHDFRGDSAPSTWLYTIAARACQRMKRPRAGQPERLDSLDALLPKASDPMPDIDSIDPYQRAEARQRTARVQAAVADLPMDFRLPLVLKDVVELPLSAVADILGIKAATAKTRVHRARLKLRRALAEALPAASAVGPPPENRQMCLDLLWAKQRALDLDVPFDVADAELCQRCRAVFATLDMTREACRSIGSGELPDRVRRAVLAAMADS